MQSIDADQKKLAGRSTDRTPIAATPPPRPGIRLFFIGLLPPPVDGQRVATARLRALFANSFALTVHDIGPRRTNSFRERLWRVLKAMTGLVVARLGGCRRLYFAPYTGHGLWLAVVVQICARFLGYRSAVHVHSQAPAAAKLSAMTALTRAAGNGAVWVCLGPEMTAGLRSRYPHVRHTLPLGNAILVPPAGQARRRRATATGRPLRIGHLGNLSRAKGLDTVLDTVAALARANLAFFLEIAGPAVSPDEEALLGVATQADPGRIRWLGPLYGAAKDDWFDSLDLFLLPSRYRHEASPLVLFEAMRAGVVPIATDRGNIAADLADAGVVIADDAAGEVFIAAVLGLARAFSNNSADLEAASARAAARFDCLRRQAERDLVNLVQYLAED